MKPQIVVTSVRENRSFSLYRLPEDIGRELSPDDMDSLQSQGKVERWLIFNDGAFEIACDEENYLKIRKYLNGIAHAPAPPKEVSKRLAILPTLSSEVPEGAQVFSASDDEPPPPPPEDEDEENEDDTPWAGETDDADDGVAQA